MLIPSIAALRRSALAVCVLYDIDLSPGPHGIEPHGEVRLLVSWDECAQALRGVDPESDEGYRLLAGWLRARRLLADLTPDAVAERIRPLGLPVGHLLHPGPGWSRQRVPGGSAELGIGLIGLDPAQPEHITPVAAGAWRAAGVHAGPYWPAAAGYLGAMAELAAQRRQRSPAEPLRPMGDCDVITLLCHRRFRAALAGPSGGMAAVGVPMSTRGWTELRQVDPAFVVAAAAATDPAERGFARPLLVTAEELVMVAEGGRPMTIALGDAAPGRPWLRSVRYH